MAAALFRRLGEEDDWLPGDLIPPELALGSEIEYRWQSEYYFGEFTEPLPKQTLQRMGVPMHDDAAVFFIPDTCIEVWVMPRDRERDTHGYARIEHAASEEEAIEAVFQVLTRIHAATGMPFVPDSVLVKTTEPVLYMDLRLPPMRYVKPYTDFVRPSMTIRSSARGLVRVVFHTQRLSNDDVLWFRSWLGSSMRTMDTDAARPMLCVPKDVCHTCLAQHPMLECKKVEPEKSVLVYVRTQKQPVVYAAPLPDGSLQFWPGVADVVVAEGYGVRR